MIGMFAVSQSNRRTREAETLLYQLEANARGLNANEWEAIGSLKIDSELHESSEHFRRGILNNVETIHALHNRRGFAESVEPAVFTYLNAMDE
jgi:hypothetical protein